MQGSASERIPFWGIDSRLEDRPGVPMEASPPRPASGAHWQKPERQRKPDFAMLKRVDLKELTPVFGTMQPPHGLSGKLRRRAYGIADHKPAHWALLLMADRVDVVESNLGGAKLWGALGAAAGAYGILRARHAGHRDQTSATISTERKRAA